ncbi:ATP-dependent DNA helicase [Campylobacter geochelonis]|uniref:ATP-dependent DNA helicase n=1 Tax=Campylobacter geochelonis TaxID=1780362 RepID=UPI000770AB44|nr:AAA family ATPase [Campylobacter geochelonis]CZE47923.1 glycosysltransferase [Campylobacter geochelonis]
MINQILEILENSNVFLTGGGGVGKSYTTQNIMQHYKDNKKNVVALGSTGISAVNIGGMTLHSFFCLGICKNIDELRGYDKSKWRKQKLSDLKKILEKTDLIVIDEISMVSAELFDLVSYRLANSNFKGKLLVVGDFYQLPPVMKKDEEKNRSLFYSTYAFSALSWSNSKFVYIEILKSKRTDDLEFYENLSHIRVGKLNQKTINYILKFISSEIPLNGENTVLFGRNKEADELNKFMLEKLANDTEISQGYYEIYSSNLPDDRVEKWLKNLNVVDSFEFKIGAKVIFTTNKYSLTHEKILFYNGESGTIKDIEKKDGQIESIIVEKNNGEIIEVERNSYDLTEIAIESDSLDYTVLASYYQFPIRLAYAITIHKSQGMSIENLVCDLNNIFTDGQLYVALSRAVDPKKLKIIYNKKESFESYINRVVKVNDEVRNFYNEQAFIYFE